MGQKAFSHAVHEGSGDQLCFISFVLNYGEQKSMFDSCALLNRCYRVLKSIDIFRCLLEPLAYGQCLSQQIKGARILSANHAQSGHVERIGSAFESLR